MLEKFSFFDAHFHSFPCISKNCLDSGSEICGVSSCHSQNDLESPSVFKSYGIHPLDMKDDDFDVCNRILKELEILENLLIKKEIIAVGECGFDFFKPESWKMETLQRKTFERQLELAIKYVVPLVIHCRKGNSILFEYSDALRKLPAVLFHSFMGSPVEAKSFLNRGINAYFSFGKQIFNGNKKVISCVQELPISRLLPETDAPFQFLKGEDKTYTSEIKKIYDGIYKLKFPDWNIKKDRQSSDTDDIEFLSFEKFAGVMKLNFTDCFYIH